jgi:Flp pilus assembly protein TadB
VAEVSALLPAGGVLLGAVAGAGLLLVASGLTVQPAGPGRPSVPEWVRPPLAWAGRHRRRVVAAAAAGLLGAVVTGWPAAGVLAVVAAAAVPGLVAPDRAGREETARVEAVAGWAEMLRDTLSAAAGLEQAIAVTAAVAPEAVAGPVSRLAGRLQAGWPLPAALRGFAEEAADPAADLVAAALLLAAEHPAGDLAGLLGALAASAREQAGMRVRVAAGRARTTSSVRTVVAATLVLAAGLAVLNRGYLAPYGTPGGQLVLLAVGGLFAAGFGWLTRLARVPAAGRVLTRRAPAGAGVG